VGRPRAVGRAWSTVDDAFAQTGARRRYAEAACAGVTVVTGRPIPGHRVRVAAVLCATTSTLAETSPRTP